MSAVVPPKQRAWAAGLAAAFLFLGCQSAPQFDSPPDLAMYVSSGNAASRDTSFPADRVYSGIYSSNFEISFFWPREVLHERWWVTGGAITKLKLYKRSHTGRYPDSTYVFVRWRGLVSKKGHFGHRDMSDRTFYVTEILSIRPVRPGDPQ